MTNGKISRRASTNRCLNRKIEEEVPFGPPPEEYNYRCSQCRHEMAVNEAIIDAGILWAKFDKTYYEGFMPVLGCPNCNQETMEYSGTKSPPEGR